MILTVRKKPVVDERIDMNTKERLVELIQSTTGVLINKTLANILADKILESLEVCDCFSCEVTPPIFKRKFTAYKNCPICNGTGIKFKDNLNKGE